MAWEAGEELSAGRHLEVVELEARRDRAAAECEPLAARHGGLPNAGRNHVLGELPARDVAAETDDLVGCGGLVEEVEVDRVAIVVVPDFVALDTMQSAEGSSGQEEVDGRTRRADTRGMSVDPLRRAPCLAVVAALGMRSEPEALHQFFGVRVHGYTE